MVYPIDLYQSEITIEMVISNDVDLGECDHCLSRSSDFEAILGEIWILLRHVDDRSTE